MINYFQRACWTKGILSALKFEVDEDGRDTGTKRKARDIPSEKVAECESSEMSRIACLDMICAVPIFLTKINRVPSVFVTSAGLARALWMDLDSSYNKSISPRAEVIGLSDPD